MISIKGFYHSSQLALAHYVCRGSRGNVTLHPDRERELSPEFVTALQRCQV
jgi:hypothetical protein